MEIHTILIIVKLLLAVIAATLAIMKGKHDTHIMIYWILVFVYWSLNALTDCIK